MDLYIKEREGKLNADCQSRSPMPSTSAKPSSSPWGQARPMGASEAGGGKRGWWGQARPMGAVSYRAKSLVNIVSASGRLPLIVSTVYRVFLCYKITQRDSVSILYSVIMIMAAALTH
jgi:hypothetical protein